MRSTTRSGICILSLTGCLLGRAAESTEQDQFEEKCISRAAERILKAGRTDRAAWVTELEAAYPGKVTNPTTAAEYGSWFELLAGKNEQWRRTDAPNPRIAALFDQVVQRMELGPVPTITRDEFLKFAGRTLVEKKPRPGDAPPDTTAEADKVFRVLDKNFDGDLDREEMTVDLKGEWVLADSDGNGRINKTEYRAYFQRKVTARVAVLTAKTADGARGADGRVEGKPGAKAGTALPDWFTALDTDKDKQISLFEWRQDGRAVALFQEMDLNGDGLLTRDEYLRWVRMTEIDAAQKKREEGK